MKAWNMEEEEDISDMGGHPYRLDGRGAQCIG